jgi:hypothetical protein
MHTNILVRKPHGKISRERYGNRGKDNIGLPLQTYDNRWKYIELYLIEILHENVEWIKLVQV